uniref:Uncharacterized protein n=1 Tax=Chelydra serpentina TaxID=8475 RepID=A0A8C3T3C7_CHESE
AQPSVVGVVYDAPADFKKGFEGACGGKPSLFSYKEWMIYSTWEPEDHILDPRLVVAYEEKEERDRASGYRKRGPKPKRLLLQVTPGPHPLSAPSHFPPLNLGVDAVDGSLPWIPTLSPSEVTVTDITANSITVTFREAQVAEGFFRDRSVQF